MSFSTIGISETWLDEPTQDLYNIPGYTFLSSSRQHKHGGGVGLFIKSDYHYKLRLDLQSSDNKLYESIFAEIIQPNAKNIIVGCIYKPPDVSVTEFNNSINHTLSTISFENKLSYLRQAKQLKRRKYSCRGPNDVWHVDGYDKIKPYRFPIHG